MSENDPMHDPIDRAYAQAEGRLDDAQARAARRAAVLDAVARDAAATPVRARRPVMRYAGWLTAACLVGFGALVALQFSGPVAVAPLPKAPEAVEPPATVETPSGAEPQTEASTGPAPTAPPPPARPAPVAPIVAPVAAPPTVAPEAVPAPPPTVQVQARPQRSEALALPAAPPPPSSPPPPPPPPPAPVAAQRAPSAFPPAESMGAMADSASARSAAPTDAGERLRTAAAAGRVAELRTLLAEGVAVDAVDASGETALMKAVQARRAPAAALLVVRGANLDRRNRAGLSARDMARALDDAVMMRALGMAP